MDSWALGVTLFKLLMGRSTPFEGKDTKELITRIEEGQYKLTLQEPITIECSLFLVQCLQHDEADRISVKEMKEHPFVSDCMQGSFLTDMDIGSF